MRVLITDDGGFVGSQLARVLLARGDHVYLAAPEFQAKAADLVARGVTTVKADLSDRWAVMAACAGMDAVCHLGALVTPWAGRASLFGVNVAGTSAVIDGCRRHGVGRLIYLSSAGVTFAGRDHHHATEAAPYPRPFRSAYLLSKKLGEDMIHGIADLPSVILRPSGIFGPGDQVLLPRLLVAARTGRLRQIGDGRNLVDLTYVDNLVHAIVLALDSPVAPGRTFLVTNDEPVLLWETIRSVLLRLGLPAELPTLPLPAALTMATVMEWRARWTGREPLLTRFTATLLARTQTYDISAAKRDLGYRPQVSVAEGIERTLVALKASAAA